MFKNMLLDRTGIFSILPLFNWDLFTGHVTTIIQASGGRFNSIFPISGDLSCTFSVHFLKVVNEIYPKRGVYT